MAARFSSKKKASLVLIALLLIFSTVLAAGLYITANSCYERGRYYVDPATAIHIKPDGRVKQPVTETVANIKQNGNVYSLSGDILNWLIIEKSDIVFEGNGFTVRSQNGLTLSNVHNVTVNNFNIRSYFSCVSLQKTQNSKLNNIVAYTRISLSDSNGNVISNCNGNFELNNSSNNTITNSTGGPFNLFKSNHNSILFSNCSYSGRSLSLSDSSRNLIFGNKFWGMAWWVSMYGNSKSNLIDANEITMGPRYYADFLTAGNFICHNNFLSFAWNTTQSFPVNIWESGMKGNYWADYNGKDGNHDGIGDTLYIINSNNMDNYPLIAQINLESEPIPKFPA